MPFKQFLLPLICLFSISVTACLELPTEAYENEEAIPEAITDLSVPNGFDYRTQRSTSLNLQSRLHNGEIAPHVPVKVYTSYPEGLLFSGITNAQGQLTKTFELGAHHHELILKVEYLGLAPFHKIPINGATAHYQITQESEWEGPEDQERKSGKSRGNRQLPFELKKIGEWTGSGKPKYLEPVPDVIDQAFIEDVNNSLPESRPVPEYNAEYIAQGTETNIKLTEWAEIWVTFVTEGAGYRNVLGYFTYPTGEAPQSVEGIDSVTVIFPNLTIKGNSALQPGDKVKLGTFPPNVSIGWVLIADGFGNPSINSGEGIYYSIPSLNPEQSEENRFHNVLLNDLSRRRVLLGFEDLNRDGNSDDDFNDAVFYITSNPITAIETQDYNEVKTEAEDTDGDGVADWADSAPEEPEVAFVDYFPSANGYGCLAFEDFWPLMGDYDFNDLVLDYRFTSYSNANSDVKKVAGEFVLKAMGAGFRNGFGMQFSVAADKVADYSQEVLQDGEWIAGEGFVEGGNSQATVILFEDGKQLIPFVGGGNFMNTQQDAPYIDPVRIRFTLTFTEGVALNLSNSLHFNPFLIKNGQREFEVHLPNHPPTEQAAVTPFGTADDRSDTNAGIWYLSDHNLPWALHLPVSFEYPIEQHSIHSAYHKFGDWAESGGTSFPDWYLNEADYRAIEKIY